MACSGTALLFFYRPTITNSLKHCPSYEANSCSVSQEFLPFYGTQRFISVTGPYLEVDESSQHPTNLFL
jgi:hypothetical protein